MYPERELSRLAARKAEVRSELARARAACAEPLARVLRPLGWLDGLVSWGRRLAPVAWGLAVPLAVRSLRGGPRMKTLGALLRWAPPLLAAARVWGRARGAGDVCRSPRGPERR